MHDADLPAALAADLDGNFERLVCQFQDRLFAFALRISGNPQDAEEIAQDAFVRAYRALSDYQADRIAGLALRAWLYQIALNVFRNRVRGRRVNVVPLPDPERDGTAEIVADERGEPETMLVRDEGERELSALVAALPERYRVAVVLRHVEGFCYPELAALLDQPLGTVKSNVHRGVALLRQAMTTRFEEVIP